VDLREGERKGLCTVTPAAGAELRTSMTNSPASSLVTAGSALKYENHRVSLNFAWLISCCNDIL